MTKDEQRRVAFFRLAVSLVLGGVASFALAGITLIASNLPASQITMQPAWFAALGLGLILAGGAVASQSSTP